MNSMNEKFRDDEKLYRAVFLKDLYQKENGRISSAVFLDKKGQGLSVDRDGGRAEIEVIIDMKKRLHGNIISVKVMDCRNVKALVLYKPSRDNKFHSEIHGSLESPLLSPEQRLILSKKSVICG